MANIYVRSDISPEEMDAFLKIPEIYFVSADDLIPSPEQVDFRPALCNDNRLTFGVTIEDIGLVGYIQYVRRNSIMCEVHAGFLKGYAGKIVKQAGIATLDLVFSHKGMRKVIAVIPADNKAARYSIRQFGFKREGCLTESILRGGQMRDLILYGLTEDEWNSKRAIRQ